MKRHSLHFTLFATAGAKKLDPKWKKLEPLLEQAADDVYREELGTFSKLHLSVILQTDEELRELNVRSLQHDYYTDILTFEIDRKEHSLSAELYISLHRARENALHYTVGVRNELAHLVIHGMLHLAGYSDKQARAKKRMQRKERYFLEQLQKQNHIE
ncbi:MAG TPA: rRNA maturation RNase YbeY [Candidatus Kapabacteria bacterium]|nr:rRNA maturation RNase YbeY [Candidatus Kapabacteria bacterium]